jgi:predicted MFS family arabinose efflux permease
MTGTTNSTPKSTSASQLEVEKLPNDTSSDETGLSNEEKQLSNVNDEAEPKRKVTGFRWFLVCVAIYSANILYGLDTTIAADIQASVSETFDNVTQLGWLGVGFTLGSTVAILPLGKAYGIFNAKWIFVSCLTAFAAGSALCGAAPSMNAIIVGRVWAGAGGAGMYLG